MRNLVYKLLEWTGLRSGFSRATYGSPLYRWRLGPAIGVALPIVTILLLSTQTRVRGDVPFLLYLVLLWLATVVSSPSRAVIGRLDRFEPEPFWLRFGARWYGTALSLGLAFLLDRLATRLLALLLGPESVVLVLRLLFFYPAASEAAKGALLLLLLWLMRNEFDGIRDGMVYGALVGLGYLVAETLMLTVQLRAETGSTFAVTLLTWRFSLLGLSSHTLWTALFGAGLGIAVISRSPLLRILAPALAFALALLAHIVDLLFTLPVSIAVLAYLGERPVTLEGLLSAPLYKVWAATALATLLTQLPFFLAAAAALRAADRWERRVFARELAAERATGAVEDAEYEALSAGRLPRGRRARRIAAMQAELALRKWRVGQQGASVEADPLVRAWREDIARQREDAHRSFFTRRQPVEKKS